MISVQEYLKIVYRPDVDYVDGEVQERNFGEWTHATTQKELIVYFGVREEEWGIEVLPGQRVQVSSTRFRIPDVCVLLAKTDEQILTKPPFLCIEVLSLEDRIDRVRARVNDFIVMGVPNNWALDPWTKRAYTVTPDGEWREVMDGVLRTSNPVLKVPLSEIFR